MARGPAPASAIREYIDTLLRLPGSPNAGIDTSELGDILCGLSASDTLPADDAARIMTRLQLPGQVPWERLVRFGVFKRIDLEGRGWPAEILLGIDTWATDWGPNQSKAWQSVPLLLLLRLDGRRYKVEVFGTVRRPHLAATTDKNLFQWDAATRTVIVPQTSWWGSGGFASEFDFWQWRDQKFRCVLRLPDGFWQHYGCMDEAVESIYHPINPDRILVRFYLEMSVEDCMQNHPKLRELPAVKAARECVRYDDFFVCREEEVVFTYRSTDHYFHAGPAGTLSAAQSDTLAVVNHLPTPDLEALFQRDIQQKCQLYKAVSHCLCGTPDFLLNPRP